VWLAGIYLVKLTVIFLSAALPTAKKRKKKKKKKTKTASPQPLGGVSVLASPHVFGART